MLETSRNALCPCGSGEKYKKCCREKELQQAESVALAGLIVATPTRGNMTIETHTAISSNLGNQPKILVSVARKPVVEARNEIAATIVQNVEAGVFSKDAYVLWVDDDAWFSSGTVEKMLDTMNRKPWIDMLSGYSCDRRPFCTAGQFRIHAGLPHSIVPQGMPFLRNTPGLPPKFLYQAGEVTDVDAVSFHFVLMRVSLLLRIGASPFNVPAGKAFGEDLCFCERAIKLGARIACDTSCIVAHVEAESGMAFIPFQRPLVVRNNNLEVFEDPRTDEEINAEWEFRDIRASRAYGGEVDKILRSTYLNHLKSNGVDAIGGRSVA